MANPSAQKRNKKNKNNPTEPAASTTLTVQNSKQPEESKFSFVFVLLIGFLILIAYTVYSSLQTYSNQLIYDME
jgi:ABC-type Na+ efflux pump permease subunit